MTVKCGDIVDNGQLTFKGYENPTLQPIKVNLVGMGSVEPGQTGTLGIYNGSTKKIDAGVPAAYKSGLNLNDSIYKYTRLA